MIQYGIFDENNKVIAEFETIEEGIEVLKGMNDGEVCEFANGYEGYYTDHYELVKGLYSRVCKGSVELRFNDEASIEPLSRERLGVILSQFSPDEFEELLVTLDSEKAHHLYDSFPIPPLKWNAETRTINVEFYYLETEDTTDGDMELYYKCDALTQDVICGRIK